MKVMSITNQKGGCGKTITAVNLAVALSAFSRKVLFIDLDPQAHAGSALGIEIAGAGQSSYSIFESFLENEPAIDLTALARKRYQDLWVIGSHISLSTVEQKLTGIKDAVLVLSNALKAKRSLEFDYIIIDTPPNLGFLTLNALHAAEKVIVPIDISLFSLNGVSRIEKILELFKEMGFERPQVNFLLTILDRRTNFTKSFMRQVKDRFGNALLETAIRSNIRLREAAGAGESIFEYDPSSNGAEDYLSLARELAPECREEPFHTQNFSAREKIQPQIFLKIHAPEAESVYLVGNFNNWAVNNASLMKKLDSGTWIKIMSLDEGAYTYKFVVDGRWIDDPENNLKESDGFGGQNSLLSVKSTSNPI